MDKKLELILGFRLLTEYHSFLFFLEAFDYADYESFRLLTEYHSFL